MITGRNYIDGNWTNSALSFECVTLSGRRHAFAVSTAKDVDAAAQAAERDFAAFSSTSREDRALFLHAIAANLREQQSDIVAVAGDETGLPDARLMGETERTAGQLELFAKTVRDGSYLDRRHDMALPDRQPVPRPDLKLMQRPIGPVAVFGASNFPLAFSVAGGDTASALAAGCPVVVKAHSAHPGTSELVAACVAEAIVSCGMPTGVFSLLQGNDRELGTSLVQHPLIKAVGFTGSLSGGRALFNLCAARPEPIPFFGELGSVNPVFMLPGALAGGGVELGKAWANSLTMGVGQFCTNPGLVLALDNGDLDIFVEGARATLAEVQPEWMLTDGIAKTYCAGADRAASLPGVEAIFRSASEGRKAGVNLLVTDAETFQSEPVLHNEVFGPFGLIVRLADNSQFREIAEQLEGQLTCTLHFDDSDHGIAQELIPVLERKAGRILGNGFPTGVEVSDAMVHGGPYPASTNFGATSVGTMAIRRFLRPVCYQSLPDALLPQDLVSFEQ